MNTAGEGWLSIFRLYPSIKMCIKERKRASEYSISAVSSSGLKCSSPGRCPVAGLVTKLIHRRGEQLMGRLFSVARVKT